MRRKLFCEISPTTYKISILKERFIRYLNWIFNNKNYAKTFFKEPLPILVYSHKSLIRRTLGNVDLELQENKAINLSLSAPKLTNIIIKPHQTFSFWKLVGKCSKAAGYKTGLVIAKDKPASGIGGGMCQMTNLIHWMVLHTPLEIVEHHHHNRFDLFPDFKRQIPFGTGTSIMYNYLDYQFYNNSDNTFQLIIYTTDTYLCGEIRAFTPLEYSYHIHEEDMYYSKEGNNYYRNNKIYRRTVDKSNGKAIDDSLVISNHSKVMYDFKFINPDLIKDINN